MARPNPRNYHSVAAAESLCGGHFAPPVSHSPRNPLGPVRIPLCYTSGNIGSACLQATTGRTGLKVLCWYLLRYRAAPVPYSLSLKPLPAHKEPSSLPGRKSRRKPHTQQSPHVYSIQYILHFRQNLLLLRHPQNRHIYPVCPNPSDRFPIRERVSP